jgi:hypothetical protein
LREGQDLGTRASLWLALPLVLGTVVASVGLISYLALAHDLAGGFFAIILASLSGRASIAWCENRHEVKESERHPADPTPPRTPEAP